MLRTFAIFFCAGFAVAVALGQAVEPFPVIHKQPITVRILGGKDGRPLAHLHVVLTGGYDPRDLKHGQWREEILTNDEGEARMSTYIGGLPFLQISVAKKHPCFTDSSSAPFSIERMRADGLSTPNRCGTATMADVPGIFNVFVKGKQAQPPPPARTPQRSF
jgi:hypothetical protein